MGGAKFYIRIYGVDVDPRGGRRITSTDQRGELHQLINEILPSCRPNSGGNGRGAAEHGNFVERQPKETLALDWSHSVGARHQCYGLKGDVRDGLQESRL